MLSSFKRLSCAAVVAGLLSTTAAHADGTPLTVEQGAAVRARVDSAVRRAATGGNFQISELNADFARYRGRVNSLISFLERRNDEKKRRIVDQTGERDHKQRALYTQTTRLQNLLARSKNPACGSNELKAIRDIVTSLETETAEFKRTTEAIATELQDLNGVVSQADHDIRFLTPFGQVSGATTGEERPLIHRMTLKNGGNNLFEASLDMEREVLNILWQAHEGFAANVEVARGISERWHNSAKTAEMIAGRNRLADIATEKQHALLEKLAIIDNSYEAYVRMGTNATLDLVECAVEGKNPAGALLVAFTKLTEAALVYALTGEQAWSMFSVDKLEGYYQATDSADVSPVWLMLDKKSWLIQQAAKLPNTLWSEPLQSGLELQEETIKESLQRLSITQKEELAQAERAFIRRMDRMLAKDELLQAAKAAYMAEASKPNKAQLLQTLYAEVKRLRGANSEVAECVLQAAKVAYMREAAGLTTDAVNAQAMRQLYEVVNDQRAAVKAAEEAMMESSAALTQVERAGVEARKTIAEMSLVEAIKEPDGWKKFFKKGGIGFLKGFAWDGVRSGAQSVLDWHYGGNWINFYKAYMDVEASLRVLIAYNKQWEKQYANLRRVDKELSDAIVLRDTAARLYNRYISKLQGTEGLHVISNEIPRDTKGELLVEIEGKGALYGHVIRMASDGGSVDLEPLRPLPSYSTIGDPQVREAVEHANSASTDTYKTPTNFELRNICRAAQPGNAGGKCDIRVTVLYQ